jgi:outer membrane biogenesis lipoprotein LolB
MNKLGLLVAIFGLAILTGCTETAEQGQDQTQEQTEQVEQVQQVQEVAPMDSTATEAAE